jgi:hypothetical protein
MTHDRPGPQSDPSRSGQVQTQERSYQPPPGHTKQSGGTNKKYLFTLLGAAAVAGIVGGLLAANSHGATAAGQAAASPSGNIIGSFTGTGDGTTPAFTVTSSPVHVRWGYSCASAASTTGKFAATLVMSGGGSGQSIAHSSGSAGTALATLHPTHVGGLYHILVTATCPWTVIVSSP